MSTVPAALADVARRLRQLPERWLHPLRRWQLRRRLERAPLPELVLLVCHGNICRSPYAAAVLRRALRPELRAWIRVESAGFIGPGRGAHPAARRIAAERGTDLSAHTSTSLEEGRVRGAALIVVMDPAQRRELRRRFGEVVGAVAVLGDLDPQPIVRRAIPDPYGQPDQTFAACFDRIERCVDRLAAALAAAAAAGGPRSRPRARPRAARAERAGSR